MVLKSASLNNQESHNKQSKASKKAYATQRSVATQRQRQRQKSVIRAGKSQPAGLQRSGDGEGEDERAGGVTFRVAELKISCSYVEEEITTRVVGGRTRETRRKNSGLELEWVSTGLACWSRGTTKHKIILFRSVYSKGTFRTVKDRTIQDRSRHGTSVLTSTSLFCFISLRTPTNERQHSIAQALVISDSQTYRVIL